MSSHSTPTDKVPRPEPQPAHDLDAFDPLQEITELSQQLQLLEDMVRNLERRTQELDDMTRKTEQARDRRRWLDGYDWRLE